MVGYAAEKDLELSHINTLVEEHLLTYTQRYLIDGMHMLCIYRRSQGLSIKFFFLIIHSIKE